MKGLVHPDEFRINEKRRLNREIEARDQKIRELEQDKKLWMQPDEDLHGKVADLKAERDRFMEDAAHREMENHSLKKQAANLVGALWCVCGHWWPDHDECSIPKCDCRGFFHENSTWDPKRADPENRPPH